MHYRDVRISSICGALGFLVAYSFLIGMVFRQPTPLPFTIATPTFDLILEGPIGQVPWLVAYLDRYWVVSVSLEAGLTAIALSILFGLNVGLTVYSYRYSSCRRISNASLSFFSALPSFFSVFSCCGGGIVTTILFALGVGGLWTSVLLPYGRILSAISALLLVSNIFIIYYRSVSVKAHATREE